MKKVSIVGFGRFGKVLYKLIKNDFVISIYNRSEIKDRLEFNSKTFIVKEIKDIYKSEVVFYAVPIESFEKVISSHKKYFQKQHLLIDVLSVKMHAAKVFEKYLRNCFSQAMLTHPMFGPDSSKEGFAGLPIIIDRYRTTQENYFFWKKYFESKHLKVIEMSAKDHDRLAANSQGITHFIGRLLQAYGFRPSKIDSLGTKKLLEVKEQTCNDSWQLFYNLQHYNPYTKIMRTRLGNRFNKLYNKLLPKQRDSRFLIFGIQGGKGSFNEEAINYYLQRERITKYRLKYLYTSSAVMLALHRGGIDRGLLAVYNLAGGIVEESIQAMANYTFKILDQFAIRISHALMIRSDANLSDISAIVTHPQILAQCRQTLAKKYPSLCQSSGRGKQIDQALIASKLGKKELPKNIATLGSKILARLNNLKIIDENLQDNKDNFTTFLLVARK